MPDRPPRLIVGLGNPGRRYRGHRHNLGFRVVEALARHLDLEFLRAGRNYEAAAAAAVVLLKPLTYMNRSGDAVLAWSADSGWEVAEAGGPEGATGDRIAATDRYALVKPLVVCDDLALPLGAARLRARGSSGGQNGLASIIGAVGHEEFPRLRLGVAPRSGKVVDPARWADHVLSDFAADEEAAADEMIAHACSALICCLENGLESAISRFNRRLAPPLD